MLDLPDPDRLDAVLGVIEARPFGVLCLIFLLVLAVALVGLLILL